MKTRIAYLWLSMFVMSVPAMAQKGTISNNDFYKIAQQITALIPANWTVSIDTAFPNQILIRSQITDLEPDMTSNDPGYSAKGPCEIYILLLPRISPDSINLLQNRNKKLRDALPPQVSKDNLQNWTSQNEQTLKILDAEPTHYDDKNSYRIKCRRVPKNEADKKQYDQIMQTLDLLFKKYND
jgi:hypothetical protein